MKIKLTIALFLAGSCISNAALTAQLGILDLTANGGINPATSTAWKAGDTYRLVFVSSAFIPAVSSTDISTYNTFIQGLANAAGLGSVSWNAIASTASDDARDNTGTNPTVSTGEAIFKMNGTTAIANNYADLWNGTIASGINLDENGAAHRTDTAWGAFGATFTGTNTDGTGTSTLQLGSGGNSTIGLATEVTGHWINRANNNISQGDYLMYGMSDVLTVIPEPSTALLGGLGLLALLRRRR